MNIKAIETRYKGCLFRSRLEARWAVFLDALDIRWEYEKEGFDLGKLGWYLPDFWLPAPTSECPTRGYWLEIKPTEPSDDDQFRLLQLAITTGHSAFILAGSLGIKEFSIWATRRISNVKDLDVGVKSGACKQLVSKDEVLHADDGEIHPAYQIHALTRHDYSSWLVSPFLEMLELCPVTKRNHRETFSAYQAARSARFEHGQNGGQQ